MSRRTPVVAVIGAGMSGIYMGVRLRQAGIDFTIYEKAASVGGVWRENSYPGLHCDVPSRYYTYPFELNPDWTTFTAAGPEIREYFEGVARKYGVLDHIRFGSEVVGCTFDGRRWQLRTADGHEATADFVLTACGVLHHPKYPDLPGLDTFAGDCFHSARWDHSVSTDGKRVAVVGTGSTGVQIVGAIAGSVGTLVHFQRTPQWICPMPNGSYSKLTRTVMRRSKLAREVSHRFWRKLFGGATSRYMTEEGLWRKLVRTACAVNLRLGVRDPELRRRLTPNYPAGCKRIVMSTRFYPAIRRPNVHVVTDRIDRVVAEGIVTADGQLHEVDVLVLATGFHAQSFMLPIEITGETGETVKQMWGEVPKGYQTIALPGFPNFFMLAGPHNPLGNQPVVDSARIQTDYIMAWLEMYRDGRYDLVAPTPEATKAFNDEIEGCYPNQTIWTTSDCNSYYIGKDGLPSVWPWRAERYGEMLRTPRLEDFELRRLPAQVES